MSSYIFETIEHHKENRQRLLLHQSTTHYHWHYDYELIMVIKGELILSVLAESYVQGRRHSSCQQ